MKIKFEYSILLFFLGFLLGKNHTVLSAVIICAIIHESGHLLCAKALNIKIKEMVIDVGGAKIYPVSSSYSYAHELLLAFSGPTFNLLCILFLNITLNEKVNVSIISHTTYTDLSFVEYVYVFSLMQAILNLLPINTLDGGRMLRCILCILASERIGDVAIRISTLIFALILWILSVYFLLGSGGGISLFVFSICMLLKIFE